MKIISFYLPQFHEIPENNEWWGDGFTEWVNVKKSFPLFDGHNQPRVPQNNNYYNLLNPDTIRWQTKLAKEAGLYGFCFYHYWFDGHMLLEKPVDLFLKNKDIEMNFCISWANEDWTNAWVTSNSKTLISQTYGNKKQWKEHFEYLKKCFTDERYIKVDEKPLMIIYRPEIIPCLNEMLDYWNELAIETGLVGISFAYQHVNFSLIKNKDDSRFDFQIEYQPAYARAERVHSNKSLVRKIKLRLDLYLQKNFHTVLDLSKFRKNNNANCYDYDEIWNSILSRIPENEKNIPGAFIDWDNTPRRGKTGSLMIGFTPEKFKKYMIKQIERTRDIYKKDMIFMFAWNEWAEGGYLEPDEKNGRKNLDAIKYALDITGENPFMKE